MSEEEPPTSLADEILGKNRGGGTLRPASIVPKEEPKREEHPKGIPLNEEVTDALMQRYQIEGYPVTLPDGTVDIIDITVEPCPDSIPMPGAVLMRLCTVNQSSTSDTKKVVPTLCPPRPCYKYWRDCPWR